MVNIKLTLPLWLLLIFSLSCNAQPPNQVRIIEGCTGFANLHGTYTLVDSPCFECDHYWEKDDGSGKILVGRGPGIIPDYWMVQINGTQCTESGAFNSWNHRVRNCDTPHDDSSCISEVAAPVKLTFFRAEDVNNSMILSWVTSIEINNDYFEIQRSNDASNWKTIGIVEGHGTTRAEHEYYFQDIDPLPTTNYYRLKQVDFDQSYEYSEVVSIIKPKREIADKLLIYPNPVLGNQVVLKLVFGIGTQASIIVRDQTGKRVLNEIGIVENADYVLNLADIRPGLYTITVIGTSQDGGDGVQHGQFIIL